MEENRSDLQVRGSAKMGFEAKHSNLEAKLPFPEWQMCGEGNYHGPGWRGAGLASEQRSAPGRIPALPRAQAGVCPPCQQHRAHRYLCLPVCRCPAVINYQL